MKELLHPVDAVSGQKELREYDFIATAGAQKVEISGGQSFTSAGVVDVCRFEVTTHMVYRRSLECHNVTRNCLILREIITHPTPRLQNSVRSLLALSIIAGSVQIELRMSSLVTLQRHSCARFYYRYQRNKSEWPTLYMCVCLL